MKNKLKENSWIVRTIMFNCLTRKSLRKVLLLLHFRSHKKFFLSPFHIQLIFVDQTTKHCTLYRRICESFYSTDSSYSIQARILIIEFSVYFHDFFHFFLLQFFILHGCIWQFSKYIYFYSTHTAICCPIWSGGTKSWIFSTGYETFHISFSFISVQKHYTYIFRCFVFISDF